MVSTLEVPLSVFSCGEYVRIMQVWYKQGRECVEEGCNSVMDACPIAP